MPIIMGLIMLIGPDRQLHRARPARKG